MVEFTNKPVDCHDFLHVVNEVHVLVGGNGFAESAQD